MIATDPTSCDIYFIRHLEAELPLIDGKPVKVLYGTMRSLLNLRNIEKVYGKTLGKEQPSESAVRVLNVEMAEARHFEKGEVLHIRVFPATGEIEIINRD